MDAATVVSDFIFTAENGPDGFVTTLDQCKSMRDVWDYLGFSPPTEIDSHVYVCGRTRSEQTMTPLVALMDARPFDAVDFALRLEKGKKTIHDEYDGSTISTTVAYKTMTSSGETRIEKCCNGMRQGSPILHYAVKSRNLEALRVLIASGIDFSKQFGDRSNLVDTSVPVEEVLQMGLRFASGEKFTPKWTKDGCSWRADKAFESLTAIQMAFYDQDAAMFEAFTQVDVSKVTSLVLKTPRQPWPDRLGKWPAAVADFTALTTLLIRCPISTGPVPLEIFTIKSLKTLNLCGSGYTSLPNEVSGLKNLQNLDVSNMNFTKLPVQSLALIRGLKSVNCVGIKLTTPPPEVVKQSPQAVARYILDMESGATANTDVLLMLIGDGEAGKTSTLLALKNTKTNTARAIGVDDRTIGIDISEFKPFANTALRLSAWDFGGQAVYAIMQQLFMSRRALYPLLWRVRESLDISRFDPMIKCDVCRKVLVAPKNQKHTQQSVYRVKGQGLCHAGCVSYESMITSWTERLQFRVPGVTVVLIATHIDCATTEQVDSQCAAVAAVAQRIVARQSLTERDIPQLRFHNNGNSLRVNNVSGEGVQELRKQLCAVAEGLDFYGEVMPASYARLRAKLREMQRRDTPGWRTWMSWADYEALGQECGITESDTLKVATRFFHDTGELRYFGNTELARGGSDNSANSSARGVALGADDREAESEKPEHPPAGAHNDILSTTVFPNPFWVVDVLRGLIRHDHSSALQLIEQNTALVVKDRKVLRRRVHRLMQRGLLHTSLLPYIWHNVAGKSTDEATNSDEYGRLLALLQAFDILMKKPLDLSGCDWVVPSLSAGKHARTIDSKAFEDDSLPFICRLVYDALPPFFDMMLVAHVMNSSIAQSVDFIEGAAAFRKYGEKALLFAGLEKLHDPCSMFRCEQLSEEPLQGLVREEQCHVVIAAASRRLLGELVGEVSVVEEFFPGLKRLATLFPCHSCRQAKQLAGPSSSEDALQELQRADAERVTQLVPVTGPTAERACDLLLAKHRDTLEKAFNDDEPHLSSLVRLGLWFAGGGTLSVAYNQGRSSGTKRFFQEVYSFMSNVLNVAQVTAQEVTAEPTPSDTLVERRLITISAQQPGAELPTMRTVAKYCARNADALQLAWDLHEQLTVLCGPLPGLLSGQVGGVIGNQLSRYQAVPELMYLLKLVTDLISPVLPVVDLASPALMVTEAELVTPAGPAGYDTNGSVSTIPPETYEQFAETHQVALQQLCAYHPDLVLAHDHFLAAAYGQCSSRCVQLHRTLLREAFTAHILIRDDLDRPVAAHVTAETVRAIIAAAKLAAGEARTGRMALVESVKSSDVADEISNLVKESTLAVEFYVNSSYGALKKSLRAVADLFTQRAEQHTQLRKLRRLHEPVWHFGGDTAKVFLESDNPAEILLPCPAEEAKFLPDKGCFTPTVVQCAEPCVIFISHNVCDGEACAIVSIIIKALASGGVTVRTVCSTDAIGAGAMAAALSEAKLFLLCIDPKYAEDADCRAECALAEALQLEVVPVLLPGFDIANYDHWWPAELPFLEKHSLFKDLRNIDVYDEDLALNMCTEVLIPNVKQVLQDWAAKNETPDVNPISDEPTHKAAAATATTAADRRTAGSHYIACEECSLNGDYRGAFDRHASMGLLASWKAEHHKSRNAASRACPLMAKCSGAVTHEMKVVDVVAAKVRELSIPCPRCLSKGILPPFCFQREACLAELEFNRGGSLLCKRCTDTVPLFELLRSEVFVSYNWGAPVCPTCSTSYWDSSTVNRVTGFCSQCEARHPKDRCKNLNQLLVSELKQRVEEEAGVTCWQDLDRLVGGKDLVKEMEAGIQCCEVVVIFLTDDYVKSVNCMKEYLFSTRHGKYIVPVLLKDYQGVQMLSAEHTHTGSGTGAEWWHKSMSSLSQFAPIVLTDVSQLEDVLFEVCERIQSRFHRAQRFATAADVVDYLRDYSLWRQTRKAFLSDHAATLARPEVEEYLRQLFLQMDLDADGFLGEDELAAFLDGRGGDSAVLSKEQIAALITEADVDCDGQLSVEEFKTAIITVLDRERMETDEQ